ncbi:hypothetical protein M409DRAFT_48718 [Zasmidium cellare ATCC 36951]|uniref:Uncharacterized protein n=1 Tax=Zasmidium cellare ATCC 36951 TaxID=1080233 RepID=A0A6A6D310_ZASCE|nr:uncharacterized protein M409DRAFT_48718 [Zasmidium cellare ATCC 36951]KAF2173794.1 hypothetical protein M409DRAFT_48718 [Zasmidium cellare ATCC 36951]
MALNRGSRPLSVHSASYAGATADSAIRAANKASRQWWYTSEGNSGEACRSMQRADACASDADTTPAHAVLVQGSISSYPFSPSLALSDTPSRNTTDVNDVHHTRFCYFGATAASLHSFPYTIVATVTALFTPYVIFFDDGCVSTSICVETLYPHGITSAPGFTVFSDLADMTWTKSDVPMSYPTTYVEYLGFEKDNYILNPDAVTKGFCAGTTEPVPIELPSPTTPASFIYPLQGPYALATSISQNTTYIAVPVYPAITDYLEQVVLNPSGEPAGIKDCFPVQNYFPLSTVVSNTCYTAYSTLTSSATTYTTSTSTCECGESTTTINSPIVTPSFETLTVVNCNIAVGHQVTTNNLTTTINQERAYTQTNRTLPAVSVTETRSPFTDDLRVAASTDRLVPERATDGWRQPSMTSIIKS